MNRVKLDPAALQRQVENFRKNHPEAMPNMENMLAGVVLATGIDDALAATVLFTSIEMVWSMAFMQGRLANVPPSGPIFRDPLPSEKDSRIRDGGQPNNMHLRRGD